MLNKILTVVCLLSSLVAFAAETEVEITEAVAGKLNVPENFNGRAVLLVHGFQGEMDEVGNLFADQAAALAEAGIASLRFDFTGEGARNNFVVTSTLDSRISETEAAFEYLKAQVPNSSYGVVGFSLGGLTSMKVVGKHPDWFQSMVLWSAAESMRIPDDDNYTTAARQALKEGQATYEDWATMTITRDFIISLYGVNSSHDLKKFSGPLLAIRGDDDFLPSHDRKWLAMSPSQDKMFLLIGGADHIFNVLEEPKPAYGDQVIRATAAWFDRTLNKL